MLSSSTTLTKHDKELLMTRDVFEQIERTIGSRVPETGGMLGGGYDDGIVTHFYFDHTAQSNSVAYSPNCNIINKILREDWNPRGIRLLGNAHSHPRYLKHPSGGDLDYARVILEHNPELDRLLLPIIAPASETGGHFKLFAYAAVRNGNGVRIERLRLKLVDDSTKECLAPMGPETVELAPKVHAAPTVHFPVDASLDETFCRVRDAYDLSRLAASRIVAVGAGGAAGYLEECARCGVAEFALIDPDHVSLSNVATQQAYRRDVGRPKVDCLAERILDINPRAVVVKRQVKLDDIGDAELERLATAPWREWIVSATSLSGITGVNVPVKVSVSPAVTVLCGLTDSFPAQARVNRLGLQFGLPTLCAQVYHEGRGAEITFTHPDTTPACHRCALRSRYEAYLTAGYRNDVTSDGTPIFSTTRLNALKGQIALALLHHGTDHPRWGGLLKRIGNGNLVQIRMDPEVPLPVFQRVLGGGDQERILFDEAVWLPQKPDCPENGFPTCPECGGTGDLRAARGRFEDTRLMPK